MAAALKRLEERHVWRSHAGPPIHRVLWRAGVSIPPPYFATFVFNFLSMGAIYTVFVVSINLVMAFLGADLQLLAWPICVAVSGAIFGLLMAGFYSMRARQLHVPKWREFQSSG